MNFFRLYFYILDRIKKLNFKYNICDYYRRAVINYYINFLYIVIIRYLFNLLILRYAI
jgi:hypothetical protein